jgi:cytoskeleton protein RodZ
MTAVGETLRRERLRRNLDLEQISRELKITPKMLEAIEDEHFDRLPGQVFAKSFVKQYARYLGLDDEELAAEVQRTLQPAPTITYHAEKPRDTAASIPLPRVEKWQAVGDSRFNWSSPLASLALVVLVMMGCAGVYSFWQRTRRPVPAHDTTAAAKTPPAAVAQQPPPPVAPPVQAPAGPSPADSASEQPQPSAAQPQPQAAAAAPPSNSDAPAENPVAAKPALEKPVTAPTPSAPSNPNAPVRVELVAAEPVWVLARTDGKYLFSGTLDPNQPRTIEANSNVTLRIGNAGGVNVTLNGKRLGPLGPKGQVRTVQLTSGGFEIVAAPKPPAVPLEPLL